MKKYYLDTNVVYNLTKLSPAVLKTSFTSVFTMLEIITGINETSFGLRKSVLKKLLDSKIEIDFLMPEELGFKSFDCYNENYDLIEERTKSLMSLAKALISSNSYDEYIKTEAYGAPMGHAFFKDIDEKISRDFIAATASGTEEIKLLIDEGATEAQLEYRGEIYDLNDFKQVGKLFGNPEVNHGVTILGLAESVAAAIGNPDLDVEKVFNSYNGLISTYVEVFSRYCLDKMLHRALPAKNDAADLTHVRYLRNRYIKMVSDDAIYKRYLRNDSLSLAEASIDADMELKVLGLEDVDAYSKLIAEKDIIEEFAIDPSPDRIKASITGLNSSPDIAMTWGIFVEGRLTGFAQLCRKIDSNKTHEFEETDDIDMLLDDEYQQRIRLKQLTVSPFTINIAIGEDYRGKGYGKAATRKVLEMASKRSVKEVFLHIAHYNEYSRRMAVSLGAELIEESMFLNVYRILL